MSRRFVYYNSSFAPAPGLILNEYPGAAVAYSLQRLDTNYSGFAIRVRRSSDNEELDIGFNGSNKLDTTTLLNFVGGGNGFVVTWYDQVGTNHFIQPSLTNQPNIVTAGIVELLGDEPTIFMSSGAKKMFNGDLSTLSEGEVFITVAAAPASTEGISWKFGTDELYSHYPFADNSIYEDFGSNVRKTLGNPITDLQQINIYNLLSKANNYKAFINEEALFTSASNTVSFSSSSFIGSFGGANTAPVRLTEIILYPSEKTNRTDIKNQINGRYGIVY